MEESDTLSRLKAAAVVLPVVFLAVIELLRFAAVEHDGLHRRGNLLLAVVTAVAAVAFATVMFRLIRRSQQRVVRMNRELALVETISTAVQGDLEVDEILHAALEAIVTVGGVAEASVTLPVPLDDVAGEVARSRRHVCVKGLPPPSASGQGSGQASGPAPTRVVSFPLSTGSSIVGHLRLVIPVDPDDPDLWSPATLQNVGYRLASAIQIGLLVADLRRRHQEGHALYDVLLQISNQTAVTEALDSIAGHARDLLGGDRALICLTEATAHSIAVDDAPCCTGLPDGAALCVPAGNGAQGVAQHRGGPCAAHRAALAQSLQVPVRTRDQVLGDLWVARRGDEGFSDHDRRLLAALADVASIAITGAQLRDREHQGAILAERERIAREMHDSLAQVLGVAHLRLRALNSRPAVRGLMSVSAELTDLADLCEDAYRDVREAILGLRESSRMDRGLLDSLRAYLERYNRQSGIATTLVTDLDAEPVLSPRSEIQVIRVIQEALTNVRKHSGAHSAVVRVTESDNTATFVVEDDGRGFDPAVSLRGRDAFGLHTMRERMDLVNGTITIDSHPGRGTRIVAGVPSITLPTTQDEELRVAL